MAYNTGGGAWELIEEQELSGGAVSVAFATIPAAYRHLKIFAAIRTDIAATIDTIYVRLNSDTGNNYDYVLTALISTGASLSAARAGSFGHLGFSEGGNSLTDAFSMHELTIPFYKNANFQKWVRSVGYIGKDVSNDDNIRELLAASRRRSKEAITDVLVYTSGGDDIVADSIFDLYGIR